MTLGHYQKIGQGILDLSLRRLASVMEQYVPHWRMLAFRSQFLVSTDLAIDKVVETNAADWRFFADGYAQLDQ